MKVKPADMGLKDISNCLLLQNRIERDILSILLVRAGNCRYTSSGTTGKPTVSIHKERHRNLG
jgi:phenylacetate-coenzyme A ligase PaaK-like adenylate-forming protein